MRACCLDGVADELAEILVCPIPSGESDQGEVGGQQSAIGEVVDGRHQLLAGEIARDSEDDDSARTRNAGHALVALVPQRVTPVRRGGRDFDGLALRAHFLCVELFLCRVEQFLPRLLELLDTLVLEGDEDIGQVDAHRVEFVEDLLRGVGSSGDRVAALITP